MRREELNKIRGIGPDKDDFVATIKPGKLTKLLKVYSNTLLKDGFPGGKFECSLISLFFPVQIILLECYTDSPRGPVTRKWYLKQSIPTENLEFDGLEIPSEKIKIFLCKTCDGNYHMVKIKNTLPKDVTDLTASPQKSNASTKTTRNPLPIADDNFDVLNKDMLADKFKLWGLTRKDKLIQKLAGGETHPKSQLCIGNV